MVATTESLAHRHLRGLRTSWLLTRYFHEMHKPGALTVKPHKVIRVLNGSGVSFVLMGTHGLNSWRSQARATEDVDVLVAKRHHNKAIKAIHKAFPSLTMDDGLIVTRFKDPETKEPRIDLMKPLQTVYQMAFKYTKEIKGSHRIPDLEMALISKFAAMVSPYRETPRKLQDAADFADILVHNQNDIDTVKLCRLADEVYKGGHDEIAKLVGDILAGRPISI
jgi:hypothetical protein